MLKFSNNFRERQYNRYKAEDDFFIPIKTIKTLEVKFKK
jgi:hypothetical protein